MKIVKKIFSSRNFQNELLQMYIIFLENSYSKKFNLLSKKIHFFIESKLIDFNNLRIQHLIDYNKLHDEYLQLYINYNKLNDDYHKLNKNNTTHSNKKDLLTSSLNIIRFM